MRSYKPVLQWTVSTWEDEHCGQTGEGKSGEERGPAGKVEEEVPGHNGAFQATKADAADSDGPPGSTVLSSSPSVVY